MRIIKIVSGGQTGVDRAALDVALAMHIPCGGWCPKGRLAEDGPLDPRYPLHETPSDDVQQRTEWNVRDSDGTLVLTAAAAKADGTAFTIATARELGRPFLQLDLACPDSAAFASWIVAGEISILNVAGPRESALPGAYALSRNALEALLESVREGA